MASACATPADAATGGSTATSIHAPESGYRVTVDGDFSTRRMGQLRHDYHRHPLMQLERLEQLAHGLMSTGQCRFIVPGSNDASVFDHKSQPADGRSLGDIFRRLHEPGSWIALYNVQTDPEYGRFVRNVVDSAGPVFRGQRVLDVRGFVFISAPPSVTPFHIDRENNFWLQIRGHKTLSVWDHRDRETVAAGDVELFIGDGTLKNVRLTEAARGRAREFDCGPGDGVYFPSTSPHMTHTDTAWVTAEDAVVISIGVVFYTGSTRRTAYAHAFNHVLRRFGLHPRLAGSSDWLDRIKFPFGRAVIALRRRLQGYKPPPGF